MGKLNKVIVLVVVLLIIVFSFISFRKPGIEQSINNFPELLEINNKDLNFDQLSKYFTDLAEKKGGRYAFEVLKYAELGPNIDLHLLGHDIGDVLYKQEGVNGITACTMDFRNACSHAIVIGVFGEKGEAALPEIAAACKKAPGGSGAYTMCFHGLGHGILAFEGYDMAKASAVCQKAGTAKYGFQESSQCISGTVMEIIGGGFHDKDTWTTQRKKYLDPKKPLSLCQQIYIPNNAKYLCYDYLTPYLFEAVGGNIGNPMPADFEKAFKLCEQIPLNDSVARDGCFGGFGKEFDGLVQSRDIRQDSINSISNDKLQNIYNWCLLANDEAGSKSCISQALSSLYWGGENDPNVSIRFCSLIDENNFKSSCFQNLFSNVRSYVQDQNYRKNFCGAIPFEFQEKCKSGLEVK